MAEFGSKLKRLVLPASLLAEWSLLSEAEEDIFANLVEFGCLNDGNVGSEQCSVWRKFVPHLNAERLRILTLNSLQFTNVLHHFASLVELCIETDFSSDAAQTNAYRAMKHLTQLHHVSLRNTKQQRALLKFHNFLHQNYRGIGITNFSVQGFFMVTMLHRLEEILLSDCEIVCTGEDSMADFLSECPSLKIISIQGAVNLNETMLRILLIVSPCLLHLDVAQTDITGDVVSFLFLISAFLLPALSG